MMDSFYMTVVYVYLYSAPWFVSPQMIQSVTAMKGSQDHLVHQDPQDQGSIQLSITKKQVES